MKRKRKWLLACVLVLLVVGLLVFPVGESFALPFEAEDVSSVILWSFWGYKEATDLEDISMIVEKINDTRLCGEFDFDNYELEEGDYSCSFFFILKNGRIYEYRTIPKSGLTSIFADADGTYYRAKNIPPYRILEELDLEYQFGDPFATE